MTLLALYGFAALSLFGLAIFTGYLYEHGRSAWRRWRCRREMQRIRAPHVMALRDTPAWREHLRLTRDQLDNLATARDKAERKIH